ncbi:hypothetical protein REH81_00370 [Vibrio rotiferianus]
MKKEQSAKTKTQPKQKTKAASGKGAASPKSPDTTTTATATNLGTTQADQTPAVAKEPAQEAAQQVSQISMSDFSL